MNELIKIENNDVTIFENGDAFISQRKLSTLCGVTQQTIQERCLSLKLDVKQGISEENATLLVTYYAIESKAANDTARKSLATIAKAGMRAYLYHEAGYVIEAKQKPMTTLQLLEHAVAEIKAKDAEIAKLNTIIDNELGYCSILRASIFLGVHEKTFSWRPLKDATLRLGMEVKRVPSPRFGYQNLYPLTAFREIYPDYDFDDLTPEMVADKTKLTVL